MGSIWVWMDGEIGWQGELEIRPLPNDSEAILPYLIYFTERNNSGVL